MTVIFKLLHVGENKTVELEPYSPNNIRITIRQGENELHADVRLEELEEALNGCRDYSARRKEKMDERMERAQKRREKRLENERPENTEK